MKLSEAFPSKYISAAELDGEDLTVTIKKVTLEKVGQQDSSEKIVLHFSDHDKAMVCNKTNAMTIAKVLESDDTDYWPGRQITIYPTEVEYAGETMLGLRVRLLQKKKPVGPTAADALKSAKVAAYNAMKAKLPEGATQEQVITDLTLAIEAVFPGQKSQSLGVAQWQKLVKQDFKPAASPFVEDADLDEPPF